ncbi:MAG: hypothetical protein WKG00_10240 [Polyangiaceae bacterium]
MTVPDALAPGTAGVARLEARTGGSATVADGATSGAGAGAGAGDGDGATVADVVAAG